MNIDFQDLIASAKDAGFVSEPPPPGKYVLRVNNANSGTTQAGDAKFGIQYEVVDGPEQGKKFWDNVNFIRSNAQNIAISLRTFATLGLDEAYLASGPSGEQVVERLLQAPLIQADVSFVERNGYTNARLRNVKQVPQHQPQAAPAPQPQQPAPQFQAPAQPAPQPQFQPPAQPAQASPEQPAPYQPPVPQQPQFQPPQPQAAPTPAPQAPVPPAAPEQPAQAAPPAPFPAPPTY